MPVESFPTIDLTAIDAQGAQNREAGQPLGDPQGVAETPKFVEGQVSPVMEAVANQQSQLPEIAANAGPIFQ